MLNKLLLKGRYSKRLFFFVLPSSAVLALSFVLGGQLQNQARLYINTQSILLYLGIWLSCFFILCHLFETVPKWQLFKNRTSGISNRTVFLSTFFCFYLISCTWILAFFPMILNFDIDEHLMQIAYNSYQTHQPLMYTLLLKFLLYIASILGLTYTWSFLMLGLIQITVMGITVSYCLVIFNQRSISKRAIIIASIYYCFFPLFGYYAISATKDGLFASFLALTTVELYRFISEPKNWWGSIRLAIFSLLMCQLRYNGVITIILITIFIFSTYHIHRNAAQYKRIAIVLPFILILNMGLTQILTWSTSAKIPSTVKRDILSLPLQQMVRVLQTAENEIDISTIKNFFAIDNIQTLYSPEIADPIRNELLDPDGNFPKVLAAWVQLSAKYPLVYFEAFLDITRGLWYINDLSHTQNYWVPSDGYMSFSSQSRLPAFPIGYRTLVPALRVFYEKAFQENGYQNIPPVKYLFAIGVQSWIVIIGFLYAIYHKKRTAVFFFAIGLCVLLPLFLLPCAINRYSLPLFLINPLCLLSLAIDDKVGY